jgi:hypothetical protein
LRFILHLFVWLPDKEPRRASDRLSRKAPNWAVARQ